MKVKADFKTKIVLTEEKAVNTIHIVAGEDFSLERGDTVVLHPKRLGIIEIIKRQAMPKFPPPYYARY